MSAFELDSARCEGHGVCVDAAPHLLALDDEGDLVLLAETFGDADVDAAADAALVCPVAALRVVGLGEASS